MRYPIVNMKHRMGGILEDYESEINRLKDKLYHPTTSQLPPPPKQFPPADPYPPAAPSGPVACYTCPDGSAYWGAAQPGCKPNNLTKFQCEGAQFARPLEPPPPPPTTTEIDTEGTGRPPIMVHGGDEIPPPVPTPPASPGGHAPVVTGIPTGDYGAPPISYPPVPEPGPETQPCPPGTTRLVPGGPCVPDVATGDELHRRYPPPGTTDTGYVEPCPPGQFRASPGGPCRGSVATGFGGFGNFGESGPVNFSMGRTFLGQVRVVGMKQGQRFS